MSAFKNIAHRAISGYIHVMEQPSWKSNSLSAADLLPEVAANVSPERRGTNFAEGFPAGVAENPRRSNLPAAEDAGFEVPEGSNLRHRRIIFGECEHVVHVIVGLLNHGNFESSFGESKTQQAPDGGWPTSEFNASGKLVFGPFGLLPPSHPQVPLRTRLRRPWPFPTS